MSHPPYFVACYSGFLVIEYVEDRRKVYTVPNVRLATPFPSFDNADAAARTAIFAMYPPDLQYYAILQTANNVE